MISSWSPSTVAQSYRGCVGMGSGRPAVPSFDSDAAAPTACARLTTAAPAAWPMAMFGSLETMVPLIVFVEVDWLEPHAVIRSKGSAWLRVTRRIVDAYPLAASKQMRAIVLPETAHV